MNRIGCIGVLEKSSEVNLCRFVANQSGQVHLSLDRPVKTQFVLLKLTGLLSVSMVRDRVEYVIFEEELLLWGTKIHATSYDRTYSREDATMEYDTPKKQKEEWETGIMDEGEHPFPFEFELPAKSMPSSIDVSCLGNVSNSSLAKGQSLTPFIVFTNDRPPYWGLSKTEQLEQKMCRSWM